MARRDGMNQGRGKSGTHREEARLNDYLHGVEQ